MNTGLFGGTFNPVHRGHVQIVDTIGQVFALDEIVVIPAANPPHKNAQNMADAVDRLDMARLAFDVMPNVRVSDAELRRSGRSYTIDTVNRFLGPDNAGDHLYLIMGLDAFLEIHTWKSHLALMEKVPIIVVRRPSDGSETEQLESYLKSVISQTFVFSPDAGAYFNDTLQPVFFYQPPRIDISSSDIRQRVSAGLPVDDLVPPAVAAFIKKKGLYR